MSSEIFANEELVISTILKYIKMLAFDRVVNVRVTLSKVMSELFKNKSIRLFYLYYLDRPWIFQNTELIKIANMLKNDENKNVSVLFINIDNFGSALFSEDEYFDPNSFFTNKMIVLKDEFGINRNLPINSKINLKHNPLIVNKSTSKVKDNIGMMHVESNNLNDIANLDTNNDDIIMNSNEDVSTSISS